MYGILFLYLLFATASLYKKEITNCEICFLQISEAKMAEKQFQNLTAVKWAHAVNSQKELEESLKSEIDMIEADIILGKLNDSTTNHDIPIMGHPPANTSDISLDEFFQKVIQHNNNYKNHTKGKGIKLDFKSIEVFNTSIEILRTNIPQMNFPVWLNADIVRGPVNSTTQEVNATEFLNGCKEFKNAVLSIGWTTSWGHNYTIGNYSKKETEDMINAIKESKVDQNITFPIRAGIAAQSLPELQQLMKAVNSTNNTTFTIWSSKNDSVNVVMLRSFIFAFGLDKIYLDVPVELSNKLQLDKGPKNSSVIKMSSFLNFSIISLTMFLISYAIQRY